VSSSKEKGGDRKRGDVKIGDAELREFLKAQRWFGDKGRELKRVQVTDTIPVQWPETDKKFAVARVAVTTDAGTTHYQLFLSDGVSGAGVPLQDALLDDDFRHGLAHAFARGETFAAGRARWIVQSESDRPLVVPASEEIRLASAEQSNSSLIIGNEAIVKLFRKLQRGVHPDVEVTRFLTVERRFLHTPVLLGTIHFADDEGVAVAGMLMELVPGAMDAWRYALDCSRGYFEAPAGEDLPIPFEDESRALGKVTRAMHEALASGDPGSDFERASAEDGDVARWAAGARRTIASACDAAQRALDGRRLPGDRIADAQAIVDRRRAYLTRAEQLAADVNDDAGSNTRTHGDYHLGQVLRSSAHQFLVIDFEGEPMRSLEERRERNSPLRDVAGMMRSLAYVAAVGSGLADLSAGDWRSRPIRESRARRWEECARSSFFQGYFGGDAATRDLLPRSPNNAGRLIALFEAEKAFYELQYELDHRPGWAWIPMRGIAQLLA